VQDFKNQLEGGGKQCPPYAGAPAIESLCKISSWNSPSKNLSMAATVWPACTADEHGRGKRPSYPSSWKRDCRSRLLEQKPGFGSSTRRADRSQLRHGAPSRRALIFNAARLHLPARPPLRTSTGDQSRHSEENLRRIAKLELDTELRIHPPLRGIIATAPG